MLQEGNVPSSTPAGADILGMLQSATSGISNQDIVQALAPSIQRAPQQVPAYFTTPRMRENHDPYSATPSTHVGKGSDRNEGIANAVSAATRMIGNFAARRSNQKQAAEAERVNKLLQVQSAMDQAQQVLQIDPNNQAAKQTLQQNQNLVQGMFQDQKFVKTLEKGFQISLTDPSQNKTEHHAIVQKGIDLFKEHSKQQNFTQQQAQEMFKKFQSQMPTQLGPNQYAMQKLQTQMAMQKYTSEVLKSVLPAIYRGEYQVKAQGMRMATELAKQQNANTEWDRRNVLKEQQWYQHLDAQQRKAIDLQNHENSLVLGREQARLKMEGENPDKILRAYDQSTSEWNQRIASLQTSLDMAQQSLTNYQAGKNANPATVQQMQSDIAIRGNELERARRQQSYFKSVYKLKALKAGIPGMNDESGDKDATTKQPAANSGSNSDTSNDSDESDDINYWTQDIPGKP